MKKNETATHAAPAKSRRKLALGRGLDALIPDIESIQSPQADYFQCPIHLIQPNPYQPRGAFDPDELAQLAQSIRHQGIIQPLLVRKTDDGHQLISGERRLRAAGLAGLDTVPVIVKQIDDMQMLEIAIVENIQRQNLNPLEEARAYRQLLDQFGLSQPQIAERVGKSRPTVANFMRLLQLPDVIQDDLNQGRLSMGHARALLGVKDQDEQQRVSQLIQTKSLSVRQTEDLIRKLNLQADATQKKMRIANYPDFAPMAKQLSSDLGTPVQIKRRGKKGRVEIEFTDDQDLQRLIEKLRHGLHA